MYCNKFWLLAVAAEVLETANNISNYYNKYIPSSLK